MKLILTISLPRRLTLEDLKMEISSVLDEIAIVFESFFGSLPQSIEASVDTEDGEEDGFLCTFERPYIH